jgi:hypothetical protein
MGLSRMPMARNRRVTTAVNPILITDQVAGASFQGNASVIWRAIHSAVGLDVTLIQTRSRRTRACESPHNSAPYLQSLMHVAVEGLGNIAAVVRARRPGENERSD